MKAKCILVVDDDKNVVISLTYILEKEGYTVLTASDGEEALEVASTSKIDLILLDISMPGIDGFEVCRRLRLTLTIPVIFLTARGQRRDKIMGRKVGGDGYVVKPFTLQGLRKIVRETLNGGRKSGKKKDAGRRGR